MYRRSYDEKTFTLEPSGGLLHASLVMLDRETESYWSIMTDEAIHGPEKGQKLEQVPGSVKTTWGQWKAKHPTTKILSVEGREHDEGSPYDKYFASEDGFRGLKATDHRLKDKAEIYAIELDGKALAVDHGSYADIGMVVETGGRRLFLYREKEDSFYRGSSAWWVPMEAKLSRENGQWTLALGEEVLSWSSEERKFSGGHLEEAWGFDTYWYIWSLTNPDTEVIDLSKVSLTDEPADS